MLEGFPIEAVPEGLRYCLCGQEVGLSSNSEPLPQICRRLWIVHGCTANQPPEHTGAAYNPA